MEPGAFNMGFNWVQPAPVYLAIHHDHAVAVQVEIDSKIG
jgi:hypothetical protein